MAQLETLPLSQRQAERIDKTRWLPSRRNGSMIEQRNLVSPTVPTLFRFAGEQFQIRSGNKPLDPFAYAVRLATVFPPLLDNKAPNIFGPT